MSRASPRSESRSASLPGPGLVHVPSSDGANFEVALELCTRLVCENTGWPMGHVLVADAELRHLVSSGIWCVADADEFCDWREARAGVSFAPGQGLPGIVWCRAQAGLLPEDSDRSETALAAGRPAPGRAFAVPVMCGQDLVAVLEFFHRDAEADDQPLRLLSGCISRLLGQLATSATLAADRARLAAIIEASDDAVIATDQAGIILSWNAGAERLYGYTRDEVLGESLRLVAPEESNTGTPVLTRVLRDARRLDQFETVRRRKNGQLVDVSLTAAPVFDREGRVRGASSIERDISRRKRFEAQCARAQAEAESANRAKSEFLANVSHELRTPMNSILGMLELSLDERLSPTVRDYLSTAHDSAQVLLFLLKDLLDFSRTEAGTFELERSPLQLRKTIRHATRTLAVRAHEKGLELLCRIHADVPDELDGDARRIQQIIMNLVGNAIKFTDSGEVAVDVTLHSQQGGPQQSDSPSSDCQQSDTVELLIAVSDTGIGIATADQQRIFSPFTQVDATSTRRYSGTGLGLTITRELVHRMSGRLWVESVLGRGSRFFCTLQLKRAPAVSVTSETTDGRADLTGKGVLIVDDNQSNRKLVAEIASALSMQPTVCASGAEALDVLRQSGEDAFPFVIVDAMMPDMDGFMFLEAAQRERVLHGAAVVMLSSGGRHVYEERFAQLRIAVHLEKPITQFELCSALLAALDDPIGNGSSRRQIATTKHSLRILVAEDTPANQKVVSAILGKRGHTVKIVENGHEAVTHLQKAAFDVVLMDAQMPTMNGLQAAAAIRHISNAERARVPIIAMTAHAMREDREKCLAAGMNDYLPKPVNAAELIQIVEKYGDQHAMDRTNSGAHPAARDAPAAANPPTAQTASFDLQATLERFGGDRTIARQFLRLFREESQKQAALVSAALDDGDASTAARAAHNLRGVALYLDAARLAAAAGAVEEAADTGNDVSARAGRQQLQAELDHLLAALDRVELPGVELPGAELPGSDPGEVPAAQKKLAEDLGE